MEHLDLGLSITDRHKQLWGVFAELICRNSTHRSAFSAEECTGCHMYVLGGVIKDMQVNRCVRFSQIPYSTENWNNPHSSLHTMSLG